MPQPFSAQPCLVVTAGLTRPAVCYPCPILKPPFALRRASKRHRHSLPADTKRVLLTNVDEPASHTPQVYKAIKDGVTPVAVKVFPSNATDVQQGEFQREVVILKSCRDRNIVQFLGACVEAGQTFLVTGAAEGSVRAGSGPQSASSSADRRSFACERTLYTACMTP